MKWSGVKWSQIKLLEAMDGKGMDERREGERVDTLSCNAFMGHEGTHFFLQGQTNKQTRRPVSLTD